MYNLKLAFTTELLFQSIYVIWEVKPVRHSHSSASYPRSHFATVTGIREKESGYGQAEPGTTSTFEGQRIYSKGDPESSARVGGLQKTEQLSVGQRVCSDGSGECLPP